MSESELRTLIQRTVAEAIERHLGALRAELVDQICARVGGTTASGAASSGVLPQLSTALRSIQQGTTQADILAALLQSTESFASRTALLVLRGGAVVAWRTRGFAKADPKGATLDSACPLISRALSSGCLVSGDPGGFDRTFLATMGAPAGEILLIPLLVREKVAALLYADAGVAPGARIDAVALECLVRFAGNWVELAGVRKTVPIAAEAENRPGPVSGAGFNRGQNGAADIPLEQPAMAASAGANSFADPFPPAAPSKAHSPQTKAVDSGELHKKAHRFAKLLVDEIRLYNQEKVEQGRQNADLYTRLGDEIEKSRSAYEKRYGQSVGASPDYFQQELVRILANNNPSLLGSRNSS